MGVVTLNEFQTLELLPLKESDGSIISRGPGVITQEMLIQGNSILSSVYLHDIDTATSVTVKYYDTTTGGDLLSERFDLDSHDPLSTNGVTDRVTVTRIHNKPVMEVTVAGGSAKFGVLVTVVSSFASDLDSALIEDGETFVQDSTKAIPIACYDETSGQMFFLRCIDGSISTTIDEGTPFFTTGTTTSSPGSSVNLTSFSVPASTTRKFSRIHVSSYAQGIFTLTAGGSTIAKGRTVAGNPNVFFRFDPKNPQSASTSISLDFEQVAGGLACPIDWTVMASDFT